MQFILKGSAKYQLIMLRYSNNKMPNTGCPLIVLKKKLIKFPGKRSLKFNYLADENIIMSNMKELKSQINV